MSTRNVRITCLPVNAPSQRPIIIDAILDESGHICGQYPLFGLWGKPDHEKDNYNPLVLRADGILDFGDAFDATTDRFFNFDLRSGKIEINRVLSYKSRDRSIVVNYLIDDVSALPLSQASSS